MLMRNDGERATSAAVMTVIGSSAKSAARAQLEAVKFWAERGQAYMDIPKTLAGCRTPHDVVNAQVQFWQVAATRYTDCCLKMYQAFLPSLELASNGTVEPPRDEILQSKAHPASNRDYITFFDEQRANRSRSNGVYPVAHRHADAG